MKWTPKQKEVIETRDLDILVSAAAGSGKTAVLTARILKLIEEGHSIDDFLVITFTRAAAEDMKDKVRRGLFERSRGPGGEYFSQELKKLPRAQISTIHSFCSAVIRENFHVLGIDPGFKIAHEGELKIMEEESLDQVMEAYYKKEDQDFYKLLEIFTDQRTDLGLRNVIVETEKFLSQKPRRDLYLETMKGHYSDDKYWKDLLNERDQEKKEQFRHLYNQVINLVESAELLAFLEEERRMIENLPSQLYEFNRYPSTKAVREEIFKDEIKGARDQWKKLLSPGFEDEVQLFRDLEASYKHIEKLVEVTENFSQVFSKRRLRDNRFSYGDLETLALKAMEDQEVSKAYRQRFAFVFVDEYQDTNELQEYLISLFVRPGGLFMVGDIKQSIYGFREARPQLFIDKFHSYKSSPGKLRIDLTKNFRSSAPILESCNFVFERLMRRDFGGIDYDEAARLVFGNRELEAIDDEVEFLVSQGGEDPVEEELRSIIARIKELLEAGASYKDIVILYRSPKSFTEKALAMFREADLPLYSDQGESYLESLEVQILLNYLEIINNAFLDLPLLSLLRLPRYGFSDQELYSFRTKGEFFHQGFYGYDEPGELLDKKEFFIEEIRQLRWKSRQLGVSELLHYIYRQVEFERFALLMSGGEQRLMNIRYLFERAKEFEETTLVGLPAFLDYINNLRLQKQDYESAKLLGEDADVIRLMSIHKSKGLQFPIVFVAGLWKQYNEMGYRGPIFQDDELMVMDFYDLEKREVKRSVFKDILIEKSKIRARQEEVRLLYVAMTRAIKKLILSTYLKEDLIPGRELSTWELASQKSFHDLLTKSIGKFEPPAPKYVIIEVGEEEEKTSSGPRAKELETFIPPRARTQSFKTGISELVSQAPQAVDFKLDGAGKERGSLFHRVMELMDLEKASQDHLKELKRLEALGLIEDFKDRELVDKFFSSELGRRLLASDRILREQPFILRKDSRLLQGVVDLAFWDQGWVLVDYKTDGSLAYLESYKGQMGYYIEAFENISGDKVREAYLYFLRLDKIISIKENIDD